MKNGFYNFNIATTNSKILANFNIVETLRWSKHNY